MVTDNKEWSGSKSNFTVKGTLIIGFVSVLVFLYYFFIISHASYEPFGNKGRFVYNNMLSHLLRGDFSVDSNIIGLEGFQRDGRTFTYFGITPALLRLPLLLIGGMTWDMTAVSIVMATCVSACFTWASLNLVNGFVAKGPSQAAIYWAFTLAILLGGPQIQFLKPSIYQEVISWELAIEASFLYCAVRGLFRQPGFSPSLLIAMASVAGLALLTRVTAGLGLYIAMGLLLLSLAVEHSGVRIRNFWIGGDAPAHVIRFIRSLLSPDKLVPAIILVGFAVLCGIVNYERWGNPLTFADIHTNLRMSPERLARIDRYGEFNLIRLWYGAMYYFFPINFLVGSDGKFLFADAVRRLYDLQELPPSSFFVSDPLLILLTACSFKFWNCGDKPAFLIPRHAASLMAGFLVPCFLMLIFFYAAFRYRGEFYLLFDFAALLGFFAVCRQPLVGSEDRKLKLKPILLGSALVGVVTSHLLVIAYKLSPFGESTPSLEWQLFQDYSALLFKVRDYTESFFR
jgi:hypothetical protein